MEQRLEVYADWIGLNGPKRIGTLFIQDDRTNEIFSFSYDSQWLSSYAKTYHLDPDIQLYAGRQYQNPGKQGFGLFLDSCPDRWGRQLMQRREALFAKQENRKPKVLKESDYLLGVHDAARMGAIRFKRAGKEAFLKEDTPLATPPWTRLRDLEFGYSQLELDVPQSDVTWLLQLIAPGSSLGGARPKATVVDEQGNLWLAKFPSKHDQGNTGAWEMVVHELAKACAIEVAPATLRTFSSQGSTFLTKRFDRGPNNTRLHFASALSLLGKQDGDKNASYLEIVEFLLQFGSQPERDLSQLFRRIIFNIAVSNTDDHLRNHGMILDKKGWKLSPAYDMNPSNDTYSLSLSLDGFSHDLDYGVALQQASYCMLDEKQALGIVQDVLHQVRTWRAVALSFGIGNDACDAMERAFYTSL